ncbi:phosphoribosylanthranilate isomerase [Syntrophus gentianae]|uniref:N-(5'-phosphoribosyl)anthranilate isomerase n=1 Tax=Syntrophus gentianae TaxID=43775 RepID=A0A1H7W2G6_9BACT|nr:phosphoribosylanthranilate isomerase [Syntrophus gentianae]SEM15696.1 phosphoribosylanthranilate isomerase [Syntrophus gentianae]
MTEIKFCGMTRLADALVAAENGADALGFIFYPGSPRYLCPEKARELIRQLPPEVIRVGVFVNESVGTVKEIQDFCALDLLQLHGDESPDYCRQFPSSGLIRAVSPRSEEDLTLLEAYPCRAILLDRREEALYGGTGRLSNWDLGVRIRKRFPLILAGGLNPGNIGEAIKTVSPHAVDINSGVESAPGIKDPDKIRSAIAEVRRISAITGSEDVPGKEPETFRIFSRMRQHDIF